jgi:outer membrane protein insertion porin family
LRLCVGLLVCAGLGVLVEAGHAQVPTEESTVLDSIAVLGNTRTPTSNVLAIAGIPTGKAISYRDIQRALQALYATGQYDDIRILQGMVGGQEVLRIELLERPLLSGWSVRGVDQLSESAVRSRIKMIPLRPVDPAAIEHARVSIDSLYKAKGYYLSSVAVRQVDQPDGTVRAVFDVDEGRRVAISQVIVQGNQRFSDGDVVGHMKTGPEGFFWFQTGAYKEEQLAQDVRERLPEFYGQRGFVDFRVLKDTLEVAPGTGKASLILDVAEGRQYRVGSFEIVAGVLPVCRYHGWRLSRTMRQLRWSRCVRPKEVGRRYRSGAHLVLQ